MGDKPRLSITSASGLKGATVAAQFKRLFNQQSSSSLSKYTQKQKNSINWFIFISSIFSPDDAKDDRIELENLLKTEDLEKLRLQGFVCKI